MAGFYASIMFVGIMLIIISIILITLDRKKVSDEEKKIELKKEELIRILNDAEIMVEELNKFSDYIVSGIEQKKVEICDMLANAQERVDNLKDSVKNCNDDIGRLLLKELEVIKNTDKAKENKYIGVKLHDNKPRNVILINNNKHKEVVNLAQKGLDETEIAKKLSMGKGEIKLILGVSEYA